MQYFLAGAESDGKHVEQNGSWFSPSSPASTSGGLCENTIAVRDSDSEYPCFVVEDLLEDDRFRHLSFVDGSHAAHRFYAGTPITSNRGINIGSFFMFDDKPRIEGLSIGERKCQWPYHAYLLRILGLEPHR